MPAAADALVLGCGLILASWLLMLVELIRGHRAIWHASAFDPADLPAPAPRIAVVVAARDEAEHVEAAMRSLLALDYPSGGASADGGLTVIAVDDRSGDATGAILDRLAAADARLRAVHVTELPPGWLGKNHALELGARAAIAGGADWVLFTDADCSFAPDLLRRAVGQAERRGIDHLAIGPAIVGGDALLGMMLAPFALTFSFAVRPWHAADPARSEHVGIGAFNLLRARAFAAVGGMAPIRMRPDDDVKLGKLVKQAGLHQAFAAGDGLLTVPWYASAGGMIRGLEKNAFAFLDYSLARAVGAVGSMLVQHVLPWLLLPFVSGLAFALVLPVVLLSAALAATTAHELRLPAWYGLAYPLGALLLAIAVANSAWRVSRDGGVRWRGTLYPLAELKANRV